MFNIFYTNLSAGHLHGDIPCLTNFTTVLVYSECYPRQIIRYAQIYMLFQCYLEFDVFAIARMIQHCVYELPDYSGEVAYIKRWMS